MRRLGFTKEYGPCQATWCRLVQGVADAAIEAALRQWAERVMERAGTGELEGVAVDGKTLRGSKQRGATDAPLLAALSHRLGVRNGATCWLACRRRSMTSAGSLISRGLTANRVRVHHLVSLPLLAAGDSS